MHQTSTAVPVAAASPVRAIYHRHEPEKTALYAAVAEQYCKDRDDKPRGTE